MSSNEYTVTVQTESGNFQQDIKLALGNEINRISSLAQSEMLSQLVGGQVAEASEKSPCDCEDPDECDCDKEPVDEAANDERRIALSIKDTNDPEDVAESWLRIGVLCGAIDKKDADKIKDFL